LAGPLAPVAATATAHLADSARRRPRLHRRADLDAGCRAWPRRAADPPRRAATAAHPPVLRAGPATGPRRRRPRPAGKPLRPVARRGAAGPADAPGRFLTSAGISAPVSRSRRSPLAGDAFVFEIPDSRPKASPASGLLPFPGRPARLATTPPPRRRSWPALKRRRRRVARGCRRAGATWP